MNKAFWVGLAALGLAAAACASGGAGGARSSEAAARLAKEAATLAPIANEEDFLEAKFLYQALAQGSLDQARLRLKMVEYLLGPLATIDAQRLRRNPEIIGGNDDFDRLSESLRDALDLYPAPLLWRAENLGIADRERELLGKAAQLVVGAYSPRGNEQPVAMGLYVLQALDPQNPDWLVRI
ncbi:MAG TPA: hypothetical protein VF518_13980, partial [Polyangia bacterium]